MTESEREGTWPVGSVANGYLRTSAGWIQLVHKSRSDGPPWLPGDVVDGSVLTEAGDWVSIGVAPPVPGSSFLAHQNVVPSASGRARWQRLPVAAKIAVIVVPALFVLGLIGSLFEEGDDATAVTRTSTSETPESNSQPDPPTPAVKSEPDPEVEFEGRLSKRGWFELTDGLFGKWEPGNQEYFATARIRVVSYAGCPNGVYVKANIKDSTGTIVGFANDLLPSLPGRQHAILELVSTVEGNLTAEVDEATCY